MKIAFFTDTFFPQINGVSKTLARFSKYLGQKGIEHQIFAPTNDLSLFTNVKEFPSIPFALYPECRFSIPNFFEIRKDLKKFTPDIIHSATEFNIGITGMNYAKKNYIPFVTSYHTNFPEYLKYYHLEKIEPILWNYLRWFHDKSELVLCPSHSTIETLSKRGFTELKLWSRGIDASQFSPEFRSESLRETYHLQNKTVLLYVGRISPEKNLPDLACQYRKLKNIYQDQLALLITGDGPGLQEAKQLFPEDVIFTGYQDGDNLAEIYASADIFVFPSVTETFGNVVLEAMASGLPVISYNMGGVKENVVHGYNGFQAKVEKQDDFFNYTKQLIDNPSLQKMMGIHAREFSLSKDWSQIFDSVIESYQEVIEINYKKSIVSA